jgi:hypothetical protein
MTKEEQRYYEDVIYPEIARKDFERELYKQMDEEDQKEYKDYDFPCGYQNILIDRSKKMILKEHETILLEVSSIAIGEIPKSYSEFGDLVWKVFHAGAKYKDLILKTCDQSMKES